jgi:hypothetical protein
MKLRSLFGAIAGGLLLTAALVPRADAFVVSYFNFEDPPPGPGGLPLTSPVDVTPDFAFATVAQPVPNPGGGLEASTSNLALAGNNTLDQSTGLLVNRTAGDADTANPGFGAGVRRTGSNPSFTISFSVNTQFWSGLSLSFAYDNAGNGYRNVSLSYSILGGAQNQPAGSAILSTMAGAPAAVFPLPSAVNGNGMTAKIVTFTLTFTNGQSNGNNADETVIDNIRLDAATFVPEPATVAGGLFGVLGLCWFQRRRLIRSVRWRRA